MADKQQRLARISEAREALEAEAKEDARVKREKKGKSKATPEAKPSDKAQRNFTDPQSRILKTQDGFIQGYNAQAAAMPDIR